MSASGGKSRKLTARVRFERVATLVILQALIVVIVGAVMMRGDCHRAQQGAKQCA